MCEFSESLNLRALSFLFEGPGKAKACSGDPGSVFRIKV